MVLGAAVAQMTRGWSGRFWLTAGDGSWSELPSVRESRQLCFASASNGIGGRGLEERGFGPPAPARNAHALCTAGCARLHLDKVWCKWWCSSSSVD